jgi:hypothetical protein
MSREAAVGDLGPFVVSRYHENRHARLRYLDEGLKGLID